MQKNKTILSFPVIKAAVNSDVDAINAVLKRYEGYIARLSTRMLYDQNGNSYMVVDDEMRRRLETKLITKILTFKVA
jgi:hypothetical protein